MVYLGINKNVMPKELAPETNFLRVLRACILYEDQQTINHFLTIYYCRTKIANNLFPDCSYRKREPWGS